MREINAAALWSGRQSAWGLRADVHRDESGDAHLLEIFGPDDLVPHCIIYPLHTGIQADEFDGSCRVYPSVESALGEVAPLS